MHSEHNRPHLSKRLRYEILRRDDHACRYCGARAPEAKLVVDHVVPVTLGGTDDPANLVTACVDCNSGKSSTPADAPMVADVAADAIRWARAMQAAADIQAAQRERRNIYATAFKEEWDSWVFGDRGPDDLPPAWAESINRFHDLGLEPEVIANAVEIALSRRIRSARNYGRFAYFCGVCWRILGDRSELARDILDADEQGT